MGARERGGAALETRRGGPTRGRPSDDRATSTNNNTASRLTPGGDNRARAYVTAVARCVPPRQPVAYVGLQPELPRCRTWPGLPHAIRRELPGVELARYGTVFASQQDYQGRLPQVLGSLAGLMVIPAPQVHIGPRIASEIRQAIVVRLPIVFLSRPGLVALAECRITSLPEAECRPRRELRLILPPAERPSAVLRASLRAMGARRTPVAAPSRRP